MVYIMNSPNHLEDLLILEPSHKDIATKITEQCLQHIFYEMKRSMEKYV